MKEQTKHRFRSLARRSAWKVQETAAWPTTRYRMLPTYLIVGAQRCGTTSLQDLVSGHPQVAPPALRKGIHYFDTDYTRGQKWYQSHFPIKSSNSGRITGEASPYYLFHPAVPARIHDLVPDVKIIALLRDPVERAISHYKHEVRRGFESLEMSDAFAAEEDRLAGEAAKLTNDPGYNSHNHQHFSYVARGRYAEQAQRYVDMFDQQNLLFLQSEELWSDPLPATKLVFDFLGLDPWEPPTTPHMNATKPGSVPPDIAELLGERFAASNAELEGVLGRRFSWT
jgi:LPS sulfotransferase NodH